MKGVSLTKNVSVFCLGVLAVAFFFTVFPPQQAHSQQSDNRNLLSQYVMVSQPLNLLNSESTAATNTAVLKSIPAVAGKRVALYAVNAKCSAGTATLQIKDGVGGTQIASLAVGTTDLGAAGKFTVPVTSTISNGMDVNLTACGVSNTGTLDVQASQF